MQMIGNQWILSLILIFLKMFNYCYQKLFALTLLKYINCKNYKMSRQKNNFKMFREMITHIFIFIYILERDTLKH